MVGWCERIDRTSLIDKDIFFEGGKMLKLSLAAGAVALTGVLVWKRFRSPASGEAKVSVVVP